MQACIDKIVCWSQVILTITSIYERKVLEMGIIIEGEIRATFFTYASLSEFSLLGLSKSKMCDTGCPSNSCFKAVGE